MTEPTEFRITASKLLPYVREAARTTENVVFVPPHDRRAMAGMMRLQQQMACLRHGKIVGRVRKDEHGYFVFTMERYAALVPCALTVRAKCQGAKVTELIVSPEFPDEE